MIHIYLFLICILSVEIILRFSLLERLRDINLFSKKIFQVLTSKNISDHWKEIIIPAYSLSMMRFSLSILVTLLIVIFLFLIMNFIFEGFLAHLFSTYGIIESMLMSSFYLFLKSRLIANE
jgi:hypothetical protein